MNLTTSLRANVRAQVKRAATLAFSLAALGLAACASHQSTPPLMLDAQLASKVTFVHDGRYLHPTAVRVVSPPGGHIDSPGTLWISGTPLFAREYVPIEEVKALSAKSLTGDVTQTNIELKAGGVKTMVNQYFVWCPPGRTPKDAAEQCLRVQSLSGEEGSGIGRPSTHQWMPMGIWGLLVSTYTVYTGDSSDATLAGYAELQAGYERRQKERMADAIVAADRKRADDSARLDRMRKAARGTKDFCTSVYIVDRGTPVSPSMPLNCGVSGEVTVGQLQDANWDVTLTARIPTQGRMKSGDSIEMQAVKLH